MNTQRVITRQMTQMLNTQRLMNTVRTLPRIDLIKPVGVIRTEIIAKRENKNSSSYDGALVMYHKAKNAFRFFKEGLLNLYRARRQLNKEVFNGKRYIYDFSMGDASGKLAIKWSDYDRLINAISHKIDLVEMERKAGKQLDAHDPYQIDLTRDQIAEIIQLKREWFKVPLFGLLFLALEEFCLPVIYLFPSILPKTCVLPGLIEKRFNHRRDLALQKLNALTPNRSADHLINDIELRKTSIWSLDDQQLRLVLDVLHLNSGLFLGSRDKRLERLMRHVKEVNVMRHIA